MRVLTDCSYFVVVVSFGDVASGSTLFRSVKSYSIVTAVYNTSIRTDRAKSEHHEVSDWEV